GCAAGMKHVTAACVTGGNPEKLIRIPDLAGFDKTEVVIPKSSRNVYDHAIRNIGVRIIEVDTPEEMENALNSRTAMIYIMAYDESQPGQPLSLENVARIAKPHNIPILVDAAAEVLTIPNVHLRRGATVVVYIGGETKEDKTSINITTGQMQPGNDKVVADRIYAVLSQKRSPKITKMVTPTVNLRGSWDATIQFFSSVSHHALFIEQDGKWIKG